MIVHNHRLIFLIALLELFLGFCWYSEPLFLAPWLAGIGKTLEQVQPDEPLPFIVGIFGYFMMAYVLSWFIQRMGIHSFGGSVFCALIVWLAFVVPQMVVHYTFMGLPWLVIQIDLTRELVALLVATVPLAKWGHLPRAGA